MTRRRDISSAPAGARISHGMTPTAERQAQQRQSRRPEDEDVLGYDTFGRRTIRPAVGVKTLEGLTDPTEISAKVDELIVNLRDGGFLDEEVGVGGTPYTEKGNRNHMVLSLGSPRQTSIYAGAGEWMAQSTVAWGSGARRRVDLRLYDKVRFSFYVANAAAGGSTADLRYDTSGTGGAGTQVTGTSLDSASTGYKSTGWLDLPAAAQIEDAYMLFYGTSWLVGTIISSPTAEFRQKESDE